MEYIQRQSLIVWLYSTKEVKQLKQYGFVHYVSERMKYAVLYVNASQAETIMKELKSLFFVRDIERSHRDDICMDFENAIEPFDPSNVQEDFFFKESDESFFESIRQSFYEEEEERKK